MTSSGDHGEAFALSLFPFAPSISSTYGPQISIVSHERLKSLNPRSTILRR